MLSRIAISLAIALTATACAQHMGNAAETSLVVFAAASLKPPFDEMGRRMKSSENIDITFSYAGSQTLAAQLNQGAQADVFASADQAQMAQVASLLQGNPDELAHNYLEIAVAKGNPKGIHNLADLGRSGLVVVIADKSVPAGNYAQQALANAGVTVHLASLEQSVTGVLTKVALGEADAGIVYASDVKTNSGVDGVVIPSDQNIVATYEIGILRSAANAAGARAFVDFVHSGDGRAILSADGFSAT